LDKTAPMDPADFRPHNFLALPPEFSEIQSSKFVILPVPYEQTTTFKAGAKEGPQAIINASQEVETFDEELKQETFKVGIHTLEEMEITMGGPEVMVKKIYQIAKELVDMNKRMVLLGGEHTTSIGMVKALNESYEKLSVLQLDAHADLRDSYQESRYSHACTMRRIGEIAPFVGVGIRNLSSEEHEFVKQKKIDLFFAKDLMKDDRLSEAKSIGWIDQVLSKLSENVYLTIDLDFFDPSIMPSVGTPEPGGLLWNQTLDLLKKVAKSKNIVSFDCVELCPIPGLVAPDFLVAKLIYKIIGYIVSRERRI
jgi:agmatinase